MAVVGARGPKYVPGPAFTAAMHDRMTSVTWSLTERVLFWTPVPRSRYRGLPGPSGDELPSDSATLSRGEWRGPQHTSCTCDTDCYLPEILPRSLHAVPSAKPSKKEGWWWCFCACTVTLACVKSRRAARCNYTGGRRRDLKNRQSCAKYLQCS